jgi:hypothetical protein
MEKKQVSTFLKILQIPTDAPAEEIKQSLLNSGWNESDANEAVRVLYPSYSTSDEGSENEESVTTAPQIVAQRYVKPIPKKEEVKSEEDASQLSVESSSTSSDTVAPATSESTSVTTDESGVATPVPTSTEESAASTPPSPEHAATDNSTAETSTAEEFDFAKTAQAQAEAIAAQTDTTQERAPEIDAEVEKERPHTDAPWLQDHVDIYDVTEEEKEEMIRTVYRTNERLTPQTIHALLGIDVDLSEYEEAYERQRRNDITGVQVAVILLSSLAIAAVALYLGLYYFEVGPFHPSITSGQ